MEKQMTRRNFVSVAGAVAAAGAMGGLASCSSANATTASAASSAAEEAVASSAEEAAASSAATQAASTAMGSGDYHLTFNGGPLTANEQHATLSEYNWVSNQLTVADIAEAAKSVSLDEAHDILYNEPEITEDYVQEDGKVIPAVYLMLRNRLQRIGQGVGNEVHDGCWDFLMNNFSEEEAAYYLKMPMYHYFDGIQAGAALGISTDEAIEVCDNLSYRGLLNRVKRSGRNYYHTLAFAHGMLEFMMDRYEEDGFCDEVFGMVGSDYSYQSRNQGSAMYFAIPAKKEIVGDTEILPYCDWEEIIDRNDIISVSPCQCRTFTPIRQDPPMEVGTWCDHPMETCIATGEQAEYYIENGIGRQIDKDEAKQLIQAGVDSGLVIEIMNTEQCDVICQCHGDCCAILRGYIAMEGDVENLAYVSNYNLQVDYDKCIQCGSCAERCPLFTVTMDEEDGYPKVGNLCVRCGQCATVCPQEARKLVARAEDDRVKLPQDMIDDYYVKAVERAKRGYIVDFDPAKL